MTPHGKHGGVEAEWATALLTSAFNAFVDADACCIGNMASASFWSHAPLSARMVQVSQLVHGRTLPHSHMNSPQAPPPSRSDLIASGLLNADGMLPATRFYYFLYFGDYDSSAWL